MKKLIIILSLNFVIATVAVAQDYQWAAKVGPVKEKGFYNILLTPEVTTHVKNDFSDLRLFNSKGIETGYIIHSEEPATLINFVEYSIEENSNIKDCCSRVILRNPLSSSINNIHLEIRNADVQKRARLTGSDDKQTWYSICEDYTLLSLFDPENTSKIVKLHFPLSNYRYFKIEIEDSITAPLQILKAGYFDTHIEEAKYLGLPEIKVFQKDSSDKKSYVSFGFPSTQIVDKLIFHVNGPIPFYRSAKLCTLNTSLKKPKLEEVQAVIFKSGALQTLSLDRVIGKEFCLVIENHDNVPLQLDSIKGFQLMNYLTAQLVKGEEYTLKFGNSKVTFPIYDLEYFRDSLLTVDKMILPASVNSTNPPALSANRNTTSSWWIWAVIGGIALLLGLMSVRMIKEMKQGR